MTRRGIQGVLVVCGALLVLLVVSAGPVFAHGGGIDSNGGHHCREAGFNSGKCAPLNSYHCHQPGCDPAGPGGSSGGSGDGGGGSTPSPPPRSTPTPAPAPQSTPTPRSTPAPRPAPPDTTPPDAPLLGRARVDGGTVTLPVTAEQGAQLRFVAAGARVHTATATGEEQDVSFTLADGRHAVSVTATDAAGNTSDPTTFRINVDTTAPDPPVIAVAGGTRAGSDTTLTLRGEPGTRYALEITGDDEQQHDGRLTGGERTFAWLLANGDYTATATLTDLAGNTSTAATRGFTVELAVPAPPSLSVTSPVGATPIEVAVASDQAETIEVSLFGEAATKEETVTPGDDGTTTLAFSVPDGRYSIEAVAVDFHGQRSPSARAGDIVVDTHAPDLAVSVDNDLLDTGVFAYRLRAEAGALVHVTSDTTGLAGEFTATGDWQEFSYDVLSGDHTITVSVIDAAGNETRDEFTAAVTRPFTPADAVATVIVLQLVFGSLAGAGVGLWVLRRRLRRRSPTRGFPSWVVPPPPAA